MRPRNAIYGKIAQTAFISNRGPEVVGIERESLLSRLLLFDEVVVDSINLGELPHLAKLFGVDGLEELIRSDVLKLVSQKTGVVTDVKMNGKRQIPLLQFDEGIFTTEDNDHNLGMKFHNLLKITGLSNTRRQTLEDSIRAKLVRPSSTFGNDLIRQIRKDLTCNIELLMTVLCHRHPEVSPEKLSLKVEDLGGMQRFQTNLQPMLGTTLEREHEMMAETVTGISNLNQRLAEMSEYKAICHFEESEAPLLFGKVHSLVAKLNPEYDEQSFLRVISITEIPTLVTNRRIDIKKLIEIRGSDECREFRNWLSTTDKLDDTELKRILRGFRARAATFIASKSGKAMRLGVNTGLGLLPVYGSMAALGEGIVDAFLLDKMLPSSGVLTFLNHTMPSIFVSAD